MYKIAKNIMDKNNDDANEIEKEGIGYLSQKYDRSSKAKMSINRGTKGKGMFRMSIRRKKIG